MRLTPAHAIAVCLAVLLAGCGGSAPEPTASAVVTPSAAPQEYDSPQEQLHAAITSGDTALAQDAIDAGADPSYFDEAINNTQLSLALTRDDLDMVQLLINAGAVVEWPEVGYSELETAAREASPAVVQVLLDADADPDGVEINRGAPLSVAAYEGRTDVVMVLLEAGAFVDEEVDLGNDTTTPLGSAAYGGHLETVELLLAWGADPAWRSRADNTAADFAAGNMHREVYDYLNEIGGQ